MLPKPLEDQKERLPEDDQPALRTMESNREGTLVKLQELGIAPVLRHDINGINLLALGFNICNSWVGMGMTLAIGITLGGTITVLYGCMVVFVLYLATAATLAELSSVYPTAGGQYHYTSLLAPEKLSRSLSYICGVVSALSWIAIAASVTMLDAQLIVALVNIWHPDFAAERWQYFLVSQAFSLLLLLNNIFVTKKFPWINTVGFLLTLTSFGIILITCVAKAESYQTNAFVWSTWVNESGWPDGVCFFIGLSTPAFIFVGLDGALHLAEECTKPAKTVPKALMATVLIGFCTALPFAIAMIYCIQDFDAVLATNTGLPLLEIFIQATRQRGGATALSILLVGIGFFALNATQQTASRLTWSLARDNAFVFSNILSRIDTRLGVPVWALMANFAAILLTGLIYIGSSTAFNSLIASSIVLQQLSFAMPALLLMYRRRSEVFLPADRPFRMPSIIGWIANALVIVAAIFWTIFYQFPSVLPTTAANMNYLCVVLGAMAVLSVANWMVHGRKHYQGPRIELHE